MFIFDAIGFGSAFALLIPGSYLPDVALTISDEWYTPALIVIIFYAVGIFSQFLTSARRNKEQDSKRGVIFWGICERVGIVLLALTLSSYSKTDMGFIYFVVAYVIFVFSAGAILPSYFDLVSRVLYKFRSVFFALNLTFGSAAGYLVSRYVDRQIAESGLIDGYVSGLILVIVITGISLIPLILIREPQTGSKGKVKLSVSALLSQFKIWKQIYRNNVGLNAVSLSNFFSAIPEAITPFFSIWLISFYDIPTNRLGMWVTLLLLSQSLGSFFVPIIGIRTGFKYTYILGLSMHFIASAILITSGSTYENLIFLFAGLGLGIFNTSQSNLAVELGDVGDAGNTNAMLTAFRVPIFIIVPLLAGFFNSYSSVSVILLFSMSSAAIGIGIVVIKLVDPVLPKVRFWLKDS
tara:strand:+ start:4609 stop:5832 length:1224 start_codon:yes stop_codon:yes gene_type:complete